MGLKAVYEIHVVWPEDSYDKKLLATFTECGNGSGYGSGQYVRMAVDEGFTQGYDFRYMTNYSFEGAIRAIIQSFWGKGCVGIRKVS